MIKSINDYLNQIRERLIRLEIPSETVREFIDNLNDHYQAVKEDYQVRNGHLSQKKIEILVLKEIEPVDLVVQRFIQQWKADESTVSGIEDIPPFQKPSADQLGDSIIQYLEKVKEKYPALVSGLQPLIDALICFAVLFLVLYPYFVPQEPLPPWFEPWDLPVGKILILIIYHVPVISVILVLTAKRGLKQGIIVIFHLVTLILVVQFVFIGKWMNMLMSGTWLPETGWRLTPDWTRTLLKAPRDQAVAWLAGDIEIIVTIFLYFFSLLMIAALLTATWKLLKRDIRKRTKSKTVKTFMLGTGLLAVLIPFFVNPGIAALQSSPPTPAESPLVYSLEITMTDQTGSFTIDWSAYEPLMIPFLDNYTLESTGMHLFFNFSGPSPDNLTSRASLTTGHRVQLFGLFYLPGSFDGKTWLELVEEDINDLDIFPGFTAYSQPADDAITWKVGEKIIELPVRTVKYGLNTDSSVYYLFHFDSETGWLMQADLYQEWCRIENNDESLFDHMRITRIFSYPRPDNVAPYLSLYFLYRGTIIVILVCLNILLVIARVVIVIRQSEDAAASSNYHL